VSLFLGIIPARYASTRFPGKPLAPIGGKPMIQWVYERASRQFPLLVVATDDNRIQDVVQGFGGAVLMTSTQHRTGTERCAEALELFQRKHSGKITHVVNIQGDEPLLQSGHLEALKESFRDQRVQIATLIQSIRDPAELVNSNVVKVTVDRWYRALYFSRSPIPYVRDTPLEKSLQQHLFYSHIGLYAYRSDTLRQLVRLPVTSLERAESLEQLRWLEHGYPIHTSLTDQPSMGVDTPEDLEKISRLI
jgi:3-deoxy-manno-octulosonate cytidylyltransferase (CMP-KDO synthetase)